MQQPFVQGWQDDVRWHSCLQHHSEEQPRLAVVEGSLKRHVAVELGTEPAVVVAEAVAAQQLVVGMENHTGDTGAAQSQAQTPTVTRTSAKLSGMEGRGKCIRRKATEVSTRIYALSDTRVVRLFTSANASSHIGRHHQQHK